jgi:hypothetical protein
MSQPSPIKRPRTKLWQFSIAHLLVLTSLIAVVIAAFRWDLVAGIISVSVCTAIPLVVVRTRVSIRLLEPLWNELDLPVSIRKEQTIPMVIWSGVTVAFGVFFFWVGFAVAFIGGTFVLLLLMIFPRDPTLQLDLMETVLCIVCLAIAPLSVGSLIGGAWLRSTWPQAKRGTNAGISSPSDKNG